MFIFYYCLLFFITVYYFLLLFIIFYYCLLFYIEHSKIVIYKIDINNNILLSILLQQTNFNIS
jgi:hypothetical protein